MLSQRDLGWIAGFLEGEGHFRFARNSKRGGGTPLVTADQKQRLPLDRLVQLVGGTIYFYKIQKRNIHVWQIRGQAAIGLMFTMYSLMSPYRRSQIAGAISEWRTIRPWGFLKECKRGHPYDAQNTMVWGDGRRRCRACDRQLRGRRRLRLIQGESC